MRRDWGTAIYVVVTSMVIVYLAWNVGKIGVYARQTRALANQTAGNVEWLGGELHGRGEHEEAMEAQRTRDAAWLKAATEELERVKRIGGDAVERAGEKS